MSGLKLNASPKLAATFLPTNPQQIRIVIAILPVYIYIFFFGGEGFGGILTQIAGWKLVSTVTALDRKPLLVGEGTPSFYEAHLGILPLIQTVLDSDYGTPPPIIIPFKDR